MIVKHDGKWYVKLEKTGKLVPSTGYATEGEADHLLAVMEEHKGDLRDEFAPGEESDRSAPPAGVERRAFVGEIEFRAAKEGSDSPGTIMGYAARFDSESEDLGGFREFVAPGAFKRALGEDDIRALRNHDPEALLGRMKAGTLRLCEDERGLRMEVDLPNTTAGRDTAESIRRGDMSGCSFSFGTRSDEWDFSGATPKRTLRDVSLADVGPVTFPAYRDTSIAMRSLEAQRPRPAIPLSLLKARIRVAESF